MCKGGDGVRAIRPTGIIRTLPYRPDSPEHFLRAAYRKMLDGLNCLNRFDNAHVLIGLSQLPKIEVLHCYLLVSGRVIGRAHIASFDGNVGTLQCWDGTMRDHKYWAVLSAPYEPAPEVIRMRGFQGFRYTQELW